MVKKMMKQKFPKAEFFIFSDDIEWVKENIDFDCKVNYVKGNNPNYEELRLMYSCKHFIISNSSFSWWGAWLNTNPEKIVVAPKEWLQGMDTPDIWCEGWIRL